MNFGDPRLPEKFWARLQPCPATGCWLWTGATNLKGYGIHGRRSAHSRSQLTHRFTYESLVGPLPPDTEIDHIVCSTRSCANPLHVKAVSHRENIARSLTKTHCKRGHELAGDNIMATRTGRRCRACYAMFAEERGIKLSAMNASRAAHPKRKKTEGSCGRGHAMRFNGKRLVCPACFRMRHVDRRDDDGASTADQVELPGVPLDPG